MKKVDYSYEFEVYTDIVDDKVVPIWHDLSEEERELFRQEYPKSPVVPKRIKIDEKVEEVVIRKDAILKRRIPDVRNIKIQQITTKKGNVRRNRFVVEEDSKMYIVKGSYIDFKEYLDKLTDRHKVGFINNEQET